MRVNVKRTPLLVVVRARSNRVDRASDKRKNTAVSKRTAMMVVSLVPPAASSSLLEELTTCMHPVPFARALQPSRWKNKRVSSRTQSQQLVVVVGGGEVAGPSKQNIREYVSNTQGIKSVLRSHRPADALPASGVGAGVGAGQSVIWS